MTQFKNKTGVDRETSKLLVYVQSYREYISGLQLKTWSWKLPFALLQLINVTHGDLKLLHSSQDK